MTMHIIMRNLYVYLLESAEILEITFFFLIILTDLCHLKMFLLSLTIPLSDDVDCLEHKHVKYMPITCDRV